MYITDIVHDIGANIRLFADDTSLSVVVEHPDVAARTLNSDLNTINTWANRWLVTFNPKKTESILFSRKTSRPQHPPLYMAGESIARFSATNTWGCSSHMTCDGIITLTMLNPKPGPELILCVSLNFVFIE